MISHCPWNEVLLAQIDAAIELLSLKRKLLFEKVK